MMAENVARVFTHRVIRTQLPASSLADGHQGRFWFWGWAQSESAGGRGLVCCKSRTLLGRSAVCLMSEA